MKNISFHDHILNNELLNNVQKFFEKNVQWVFGSQSDRGSLPFGHWNYDFINADPHSQSSAEEAFKSLKNVEPILELWQALKGSILSGHELVRCYANAHTYGVEGYPHVDSRMYANFTTLLYLNPVWHPDWAGETLFFNEAGDIVAGTLPKFGRVIHFDGRISHVGRGVSRRCPALRVALVFKTVKRTESDVKVPEKFRSFLLANGAAEKDHSSYTLYDHLSNTYGFLKRSHCSEEVCLAGLFHSVYGTAHFKDVTIEPQRRSEVRELIGAKAEELVWFFCRLNRPQIFEASEGGDGWVKNLPLETLNPEEAISGLLQMECANILEQKELYRFPRILALAKKFQMIDENYLPN